MISPTTSYTAGGLSVVLTFISTIVCGRLLQHLSDDQDAGGILFVDMAFHIICCMALIFSILIFVPKKKQDASVRWGSWRHLTLITVGFVLLLTVALTAAAIQPTRDHLSSDLDSKRTKLFHAWMCLWALSLVSQVIFYALLLRANRPVRGQDRAAGCSSPDHEIRSISRSISKLHRSHGRRSGDYPCSKRGKCSASSVSTQRGCEAKKGEQLFDLLRRWSSGIHALWPKIMNARREKESGKPAEAGPARAMDGQPQHEHGFDQWETSDFARELHETLDLGHRVNHLNLKALPPVPQEGQLRSNRKDSPPLPLSPILTTSPLSWSPSLQSPTARSPTSPDHHVHPLFRADSQSPPPTPTPGTCITGPAQSRTIGVQGLRRIRSNGSVYPRNSYDRSEFSLDNDVIHEQDEEEQAVTTPSCSSSPTIPPFILEADLRRSFIEYEYGKNSL